MNKLIILLSFSCVVYSKVKLEMKDRTELSLMLRGGDKQNLNSTIFIKMIEGSRLTYARCGGLCSELGKPNYYTEVTEFPGYGKIFRCQCGESWTSWFNEEDLKELSPNILLGDSLFNEYMKITGFDASDCECDALKGILSRLI